MTNGAHHRFGRPRTRGVTLVEVLIALLLGLVLVAATLAVLLSTSRTNDTLSALVRTQEAGRLALLLVERDVRMAGYRGCAFGIINTLLDEGSASYRDALYDFNAPVFGLTQAQHGTIPEGLLGDDFDDLYARGGILVVKSAAAPMNLALARDVERNDDAVVITNAAQLPIGQLVLINDCSGGGDLFQIATDDPLPSDRIERNAGADGIVPGNVDPGSGAFSRYYEAEETELLAAESNVYYVGFQRSPDGTVLANTCLRRVRMGRRVGGVPLDEELVEGVFDMRIQYGVDVNADSQADRYEAADAITGDAWEDVVSVRVGVLAYSGAGVATPPLGEDYEIPFDETLWDFPDDQEVIDAQGAGDEKRMLPPDANLYRFFSTTVAARNRVP